MGIGTGGGLAGIGRTGRTTTVRTTDGLLSNSVYSVDRDDMGRLWVSTVAGVNCIARIGTEPQGGPVSSRRPITVEGVAATILSYPFETTYFGREFRNGIWFAGIAGAACYTGKDWFLFRGASGLPPAGGSTVAVDDAGYVWVGTPDNGLYRSVEPFNPEHLAARRKGLEVNEPIFQPIWNRSKGSPSDSVRSILYHDRRVWAGTPEGLVALAPATKPPKPLATLPPSTLGGSMVAGLAAAPNGAVWVSQNAGVVELDPNTYRITSRVSKVDGLIEEQAWAYTPVTIGDDGRVYLATPAGVSVFAPSVRQLNIERPLIRFRHVESSNDRWRGNNELSIEYAALTYSDESRVRYRTRLFGYDRDWSPDKTDVKIRYTNLPAWFFPHRYVFAVMARNSDGVWTASPLQYELTVHPALWLTWWAWIGYVAIVVLIATGVNRIRVRHL